MHNEESLLPYWLRHYEKIADRIFVWDDDSTDNTRKILKAHKKVKILPIGKKNSDDVFWITKVFPRYEKISKGKADWVIVADADEFIYHPNLREVLEEEQKKGVQAILCQGYSMISDHFPKGKKQIYDEIKLGLPDKMESKWTVHQATAKVRFAKGRHGPLHNRNSLVRDRNSGVKLLHYRFLGKNYVEERNKKLFVRHNLMFKLEGKYHPNEIHTMPDKSRGPMLTWFDKHKNEAINVVDRSVDEINKHFESIQPPPEVKKDINFPGIMELAHRDFWRATMYTKIFESVKNLNIAGTGVEFGGSNGVLQSMFPEISWETRKYPPYDITDPKAFEKNWDIILADQVLEHVQRPWDAIKNIGEHTNKLAIITVPFLIGIHPAPHDYWRMTPRTINDLAWPYFPNREFGSWGTIKGNYWHSIYNRTSVLFASVPEKEIEAELYDNQPKKPFVIWTILKK